jgi:hypothetical protein
MSSQQSDSSAGEIIVPEKKLWAPKAKKTTHTTHELHTTWVSLRGHGTFNCQITDANMSVDSNVMCSISEMNDSGVPFIGNAAMSVLNVAPFNNGVWVKVNIAFDRDLNFQLMFIWSS